MDINEIAHRAGVSRATVSRYLNNGYVSSQKRDLISRVIEETGYVPSRHAQQLRTGKTYLVGVIIPKINSNSVSRMVAGITDTLSQQGYQILMASTNNDEQREVEYLKLLDEKNRVDGIILIATVLTKEHQEAMSELHVPLVVLGQHFDTCDCIYQDDYNALFDITSLVLPKARCVGYLGVNQHDIAAGKERHRGFLDACAQYGIQVREQAEEIVSFDADSAYFGAERILHAVPDIDTIVCATDTIAYGAMACLYEYGKSIPDDVQITGAGDSLLSRIGQPTLTTVHLHYKTSGMRAAETLLERMKPGMRPFEAVKMPYEVYGRNSMR